MIRYFLLLLIVLSAACNKTAEAPATEDVGTDASADTDAAPAPEDATPASAPEATTLT